MKRFLIIPLILVSLFHEILCDAASIENQIDQAVSQKQGVKQEFGIQALNLSLEASILDSGFAQCLQSKINAVNSYGSHYNVTIQCDQLNITRNISEIAQAALNDSCPQPPISDHVQNIYRQYLWQGSLQVLVSYYQQFVDEQYDYIQDVFQEQAFYTKLREIQFRVIQNYSNQYQECLQQNNASQNTQPSQCNDQKNLLDAAAEIYNTYRGWELSFGRLTKLPLIDLQNKNKTLIDATLALQQLQNKLSQQLNQLNSQIDLCKSGLPIFHNSLNLALRDAVNANNILNYKLSKIGDIQSVLNSFLPQLRGHTNTLRNLAASLKEEFP